MDRRISTRSKRRIPCEFQYQGHRYRGIAVNVSPGGLFIQTNATLDPGADLEVVFLGDRLRGVSLRGTVARRRAPPAALASVIHAGLGLRIVEAPDAYLEFLGMGPPPREAKQRSEHPAEALATPLSKAAAVLEASQETAQKAGALSAAEPDAGESGAEDEEARAPETLHRSEALLIDDGELDDVCAMLEALGVDPVRHQEDLDEGFRDWEKPPRAVVVSASAAVRLAVGTRARESGIVTIAVAESGSRTLAAKLRGQGFDYVVRRPIHPEALRLLLMRALYRGSERRSQRRLPVGCQVTGRWGFRRRPVTLLEISGSGCRFLGAEAPKPGARVSVRIPGGVAGEHSLTLRGRAQRSERRQGAPPEASNVVALVFDPLSRRTREHLERLLAAWVTAPPAVSRAVEWTSPDAKKPAPGAGTDARSEATRRVRRRWRRTSFDRRPNILQGQPEWKRQVLFARDLSIGGARVDSHPDLQVGDRFKLALYDHASPDSIVVDAQVLRDEGEGGLALRFLNSPTRTAQKIGRLLERVGEIERCDTPGDPHPVIVAEVVQEERA